MDNKKAADRIVSGGKSRMVVSPKGLALIAAVETGLLPEVDGGWDDRAFERFWTRFTQELQKQGADYLKNQIIMLYQKS